MHARASHVHPLRPRPHSLFLSLIFFLFQVSHILGLCRSASPSPLESRAQACSHALRLSLLLWNRSRKRLRNSPAAAATPPPSRREREGKEREGQYSHTHPSDTHSFEASDALSRLQPPEHLLLRAAYRAGSGHSAIGEHGRRAFTRLGLSSARVVKSRLAAENQTKTRQVLQGRKRQLSGSRSSAAEPRRVTKLPKCIER